MWQRQRAFPVLPAGTRQQLLQLFAHVAAPVSRIHQQEPRPHHSVLIALEDHIPLPAPPFVQTALLATTQPQARQDARPAPQVTIQRSQLAPALPAQPEPMGRSQLQPPPLFA